MATVEEKQATIAKLQAELQEVEYEKMVEGLVKDIEHGPFPYAGKHYGKIIARSVKQKFGYFIIPDSVLEKVAQRLNLQYVKQEHFSVCPSWGSDNSCTYLIPGPPAKPECDKCPTCGK